MESIESEGVGERYEDSAQDLCMVERTPKWRFAQWEGLPETFLGLAYPNVANVQEADRSCQRVA